MIPSLLTNTRSQADPVPLAAPPPPPDPPTANMFDDINLLDDPVPQLDLSFGGTDNKDKGSGFGFGGWGSSWDTGNKWDFNGADAAGADIAGEQAVKDTKATTGDAGESNAWSFGGNKKNKKKTTTSRFDFGDFRLDEMKEEEPAVEENPGGEEDDRGGFMSVGKKDKKKGKKGAGEEAIKGPEPAIIDVPLSDPADAGDTSWGGWGAAPSKKDAKKGKKGATEADPSVNNVPPPPPAAPVETAGDEGWGAFGSKKDKKKGKKGAVEEPTFAEEPAAVNVPVPEPEPVVEEDWGAFSTKKDKKKGRKGAAEEVAKPAEIIAVVVPDPEPVGEDIWGDFNTKKDKKKGKKGPFEDLPPPEEQPIVVAVPDPAPADEGWGNFGTKKDKKKGKKGAVEEPVHVDQPAVVVVPETEPAAEEEWGTSGAKNDKKKSKKSAFEDLPQADDYAESLIPEAEPAAEDTWGIWGTGAKKDKKGKKNAITEVKGEPIAVVETAAPIVEAAGTIADDDLTSWAGAGKKKDKKGRKGSVVGTKPDEALLPPPPPPPPAGLPDIQDTFKNDDWDTWGTSKKEKDKKGKKGKAAEPDPPIVTVPEPVVETKAGPEDEWDTLGLSSKDKKKKEKEKEKAAKKGGAVEVVHDFDYDAPMADTFPEPVLPVEDDTWGTWGGASKKDKKNGGKKVKEFEVPPPAPPPPFMPGLDEPEEDEWGSLAPVKSKGKKDAKADTPTRTSLASKITKVEESKVGKKNPKDKDDDLIAMVSESPKDKGAGESKKDGKKDETPAKAAKSFWGGYGSTPATKNKSTKDKDDAKAAEIEYDDDYAEEEEDDAIHKIIEEPPPKKSPKDAKGKADSKLIRTNTKESDKGGKGDDKKKKGDTSALVDIVEEPLLDTSGSRWGSMDAEDKLDAKDGKKDEKKDDAWSFWGSKKTSGKKADEPKKEITKPDLANQKASLAKVSNAPEVTPADEAAQPPKTTMSTIKASDAKAKLTGKLSVAEKIKALEKEKEKKLEAIPPPPAPEPKPLPKADSPPVKASAFTKSKSATANKSAASKKKDLSPPADQSKSSGDSVPGSFPSEGAYDDSVDVVDLPPAVNKSSKKSAKSQKEPAMVDMLMEAPPPPPAPPAPPTPPPEPVASKPVKKERARVVRDEGAGSWGFWGSAPKKDVKKERRSKDDADVAPPPPKEKVSAPGLTRSKSTKTPKGKEREVEKSSGSDKEKRPEPKPAKARGMGFAGMFGASTAPARTKSGGRFSTAVPKSTSRRESVDVGAVGIPSPPPDDLPDMNAKAAKLMGMGSGKLGRKESTRGKQKAPGMIHSPMPTIHLRPADLLDAVVPDPYAIDDDDMVLVNDLEDPVINALPPLKESRKAVGLERSSKSKSKREVGAVPNDLPGVVMDAQALPGRSRPKWEPDFKPFVKADSKTQYKQFKSKSDPAEDIVMVEGGPSTDGPDVVTGPDDLDFVEKPREPPRLKRSATTSTKNPAKLMGLFGSFRNSRRASEAHVLPKSKGAYGDDDSVERRKRTVTGGGDDAKRLRRDKRDIGEADTRDLDVDGFTTDAAPNGGASTEAEDAETRREERRAKRALREQADKEAREADLRAAEDRRARRREAEQAQAEADRAKRRDAKARKVKEQDDREAQRQADKRARRAARDEMNAKIEASRDGETRGVDRRSRRRDEDPIGESSSRPHRSDRRRSYVDKPISVRSPGEDTERRHHRTHRTTTKDSSRRKSAPPVEDYFDPRNGTDGLNTVPLPAQDPPYMPHNNGANDHTSTWVNSQIIEPPAPPPIEPSVIEPVPATNGDDGGVNEGDSVAEETARRAPRRSSHRQSRYADMGPDEVDERRRRRESRRIDKDAVRSSEGSGEGDRSARRKSEYSGGYAEKAGVRTFDGRAANGAGAKRASWFKKITNLQM